MPRPIATGFLVKAPPAVVAAIGKGRRGMGIAGSRFVFEPLFTLPTRRGVGLAASESAQWFVARPPGGVGDAHAWELAHQSLRSVLSVAGSAPAFIEPDLVQEWPYENPASRAADLAVDGAACVFNDQLGALPGVPGSFAWHLGDEYSQLRSARQAAGGAGATPIRVFHLDTGFDPLHQTRPAHLNSNLQRNFVPDENDRNAQDPARRGLLKNPGHGTGTLSILAGGRFHYAGGGYAFDEPVGGAPDAEVVPVRVASSVVQVMTSGIAKGLGYAAELCGREETRVHVLSMSMGGVASAAWADAVNHAYEAGIVLVTAAGNNFSAGLFGVPSHFIVYPARFGRVIAACGVMANHRPYYGLPLKTMQGSWGPTSKMATAIAAYTPNVSWAELGCPGIVDMEGSGTSAATPQVAATAALYLQRHGKAIFDRALYPQPWMRVEAVRHALFTSADTSADGGSHEKVGNGVIQAARALAVSPLAATALRQTAADKATFAFLRVLTGVGLAAPSQVDMLALEATQLAHRWEGVDPNALEAAVPDPDLPPEAIPPDQTRRYLEALLQHPDASPTLRAHVDGVRTALFGRSPVVTPRKTPRRAPGRDASAGSTAAVSDQTIVDGSPADTGFVVPEPAYRALRGYAVDPSLSTKLTTAPLGEVTFHVPWERLQPGPVGEYLEVIDIDPASKCCYQPVDLDDPRLLAQDGLAPSEGTPQFHQQMVYAVASMTIKHFERSLGRRALWRPGPPEAGQHPKDDSHYVPRLRIYPHALREPNAYYSPEKIALLFGHFAGAAEGADATRPGPAVFTCLSHDIVAHETTHALLDGMHRRFLRGSNPDVLAFHEAFADIVSLFQHFTFPELLTAQIAQTRGDIRAHENLLGQLALQFGQSTGLRRALRDAIGDVDESGAWHPSTPNPTDYDNLLEPHARGGLLVAATFDAFLSIYERRTADLLRLATGGSGVLEPGAIHPDLVARLAQEASTAALHVLTICIRALDYCPPVDMTFGEFLRAILTADADLIRHDKLNYRVAFLEAFRRRGIQPRDVRTASIESMLWRSPETEDPGPSRRLVEGLRHMRAFAKEFLFAESLEGGGAPRAELFALQRQARLEMHSWLDHHLRTSAEGQRDARYLGINPGLPFEVHSARFAFRTTPEGEIVPQALLTVLQEVKRPVDPAHPDGEQMHFEGGAAIVGDLRRQKIRCCIRKNITSSGRLARQRAFTQQRLTGSCGRPTWAPRRCWMVPSPSPSCTGERES